MMDLKKVKEIALRKGYKVVDWNFHFNFIRVIRSTDTEYYCFYFTADERHAEIQKANTKITSSLAEDCYVMSIIARECWNDGPD